MHGPSQRYRAVCVAFAVFFFCLCPALAQEDISLENLDALLKSIEEGGNEDQESVPDETDRETPSPAPEKAAPEEKDEDDAPPPASSVEDDNDEEDEEDTSSPASTDEEDADDEEDDDDEGEEEAYESESGYYRQNTANDALEKQLKNLQKEIKDLKKSQKIASARAKALAAKMEVVKHETEKSAKESLFDWHLTVAMDVTLAEDESNASGLSIPKASIYIAKEVLDGKMRFVLEPQYSYDGVRDSHEAGFGVASFDISLIERNTASVSSKSSNYEFGFAPLYGRNRDHHDSRYTKSYLAMQVGLQNVPFGAFARYDDPTLMFVPSSDLVSELSDQEYWDVALRLYGGHDWFVWDSWMARGRLDRWSAGARFGVTPMDRMEFGLAYKCDFVNFTDDDRVQDGIAYFIAGVWRMDFLTQFLYQEVANARGDRLYNTGGNFEARIDVDRLYGAMRFDGMYMGADKFYWRFTPAFGFWAYPKIFTVRAQYQINSEAEDDFFLFQLMAHY